MTDYLLALRFALLNIVGFTGLFVAHAFGLVRTALAADSTGLTALIGAVFLGGLALCTGKVWKTSTALNAERDEAVPPYQGSENELQLRLFHRIAIVRNVANSLVLLGLIGTVLGFIIALGGVDPKSVSDINSIGPMVATLVRGMSTALYTTLVGAVLNIWLMANYHLLAGGTVKLINATLRRQG